MGLLISHITYSASKWSYNTFNNSIPLGYDICEAYYKNPRSATAADTYPGSMKITSFVPVNNASEELPEHTVNAIRYGEDKDIIFHYGESSGYGFDLSPRSLPTIMTELLDDTVIYHAESLSVSGAHLSGKAVNMTTNSGLFQISGDGKTWSAKLTDSIASDSTFSKVIYIRHVPMKACNAPTGLVAITTDDELFSTQLLLRGYSYRPVLISPVQTLPAEQVTPYTFVARWQEEQDAEFYFFTLYKLTEGSTVLTSQLPKTAFAAEGESAETEMLPTAAASLQLSVSHSFLGDDIGGVLVIEGKDDGWQLVDSLIFRPISPNNDFSWTLSGKRYMQFRIRYHHFGGKGSVRVDKCTIALNRQTETIYSDEDYMLYAPLDEAQLSDLQPNTEYSYQLSAMEEKGCEKHVTALGPATIVRTLKGAEDVEKNLTVYVTKDRKVMVYLPVIPKETDHLLVHDIYGSLIEDVPLNGMLYQAQVPTVNFVEGNIYCVQLVQPEDGKTSLPLSRKARWAKFLY